MQVRIEFKKLIYKEFVYNYKKPLVCFLLTTLYSTFKTIKHII